MSASTAPLYFAAVVFLLAVSPAPSQYEGITSATMYHRMFEEGRLRRAAAMAAKGDCAGAVAYARKEKSSGVLEAIERLCERPAAVTGVEVGPERPGILLEAEVAAFAADPRRPLFELVRHNMAELLKSGRATTLEGAYEMAVTQRTADAQAAAVAPPQKREPR